MLDFLALIFENGLCLEKDFLKKNKYMLTKLNNKKIVMPENRFCAKQEMSYIYFIFTSYFPLKHYFIEGEESFQLQC